MSPEERKANNALESLIARYLEAEKSGQRLDRDGLIKKHPDLADSLRDFFANHDRMKAAANLDEPTLPPTGGDPVDPTMPPNLGSQVATIPPRSVGDDPTLPPTKGASSPAKPSVGDQVRYFGDYELLEEIARGGMGVVFKARQVNLNRIVALKMILAGQFAGQEDVQRFYTEAEAAAQLDHPGIVPIFEIGEHAGQHYFSMAYIEGESLAHKVADGPLPPREAAELVKKICEAMAYAHERGVIHRDLKPANILIDRNGQPKITDFGLAKKTEADINLTGTGQILGTPAYMPPEQASGKPDVGPLADVYSLGAILYCLLTGRPPFQAASLMDTLLQVLDKEPISPRQLNPAVPVDLETICLKCLSKESRRRYDSSHDLSEELQRYLDGKPVLARPVGQVDRSWRWCKRNPTTAALLVLSAFLLLSGSAFSTHFALASKRDASLALGAKILAEQNAAEAVAAKSLAETEKFRADQEAAEALAEKGRADVQRDLAEEQEEKAAWRLYANQIASAKREWDADNVVGAKQQLNECRWDLRGWEHDYLYTQFSRMDDVIVTTDPVKGIRLISCVAYSPDGQQIASGNSNGSIQICNADTGRQQLLLSGEHGGRISSILFSSDGSRIVSGSSGGRTSLVVWDAVTGKQMHALGDSKGSIFRVGSANGGVRCIALNPDESKVIACYHDGTLKTWDIATGEEIESLARRSGGANRAAISLNGQRFATGSSRELTIWDSAQGQLFRALETKSDPSSGFLCLAFSPDGKRFVSAGHLKVKIWETASGRLLDVIRVKHAIHCIAFSPDGERLVGGTDNGTLMIWDIYSGRDLITLKGHVGPVEAVAFSPDGQKLVSGGIGRSLMIWDATGQQTIDSLAPKDSQSLRFGLDGKRIVRVRDDKTLIIWQLETGREEKELYGHKNNITCVVISADRKVVASGSRQYSSSEKENIVPGELKVWDLESSQAAFTVTLDKPLETVNCIAFSPDGTRIAVGLNNTINFWDVATGKVTMTLKGGARSLAFSPDGSRLAIGNDGLPPHAKVWDVATGQEFVVLEAIEHSVLSVAFSPDGKRILTAGGNTNPSKPAGELILWDAVTGRLLSSLKGHAKAVYAAAFSPDGRQIVSVGYDGLRVWDAAAGQQTLSLSMIYGSHVAFTPDATRIVCGATILDASKRQMNADLAVVINLDVWKRVSVVNGRHLSDWQLSRFAKICQQFPEPAYFQTLGAAQYRARQYKLAIESLERASKRKTGSFSIFTRSEVSPARLALLAMSHFQLGNMKEANGFHQQLVETMKLAEFEDDDESKRLLDEANDLFEHAEGKQD